MWVTFCLFLASLSSAQLSDLKCLDYQTAFSVAVCCCGVLNDTSNFRPCSFFENLFCETYVFWVPSFSRSAGIPGIQHLQTQTTCNLLYIQPSRHGPIAIPLQQLLFLVTPRQTLNLNINQLLWQDNYMHYGTVQQTATVVLAAGNSFVEKYTSTPSSTQPHTHHSLLIRDLQYVAGRVTWHEWANQGQRLAKKKGSTKRKRA